MPLPGTELKRQVHFLNRFGLCLQTVPQRRVHSGRDGSLPGPCEERGGARHSSEATHRSWQRRVAAVGGMASVLRRLVPV